MGDGLDRSLPFLRGGEWEGEGDLFLLVHQSGENTAFSGRFEARSTAVKLPGIGLSIEGLQARVPLDFSVPRPILGDARRETLGLIEIKALRRGMLALQDLHLPLTLYPNGFQAREELELPFAGGKIRVAHLRGEDLLSPQKRLEASLNLDSLEIASLTQGLGTGTLSGRLDGDFPMIRYRDGRMELSGKAIARIFGGEVEAIHLHSESPFSRGRKLGGDFYFRQLDLERISERTPWGKVTGIVQGSLQGLEIVYGQPSRFILDLESVPTQGVKQRISVEAVKNLSYLGTGSFGVAQLFNQGVNRFFSEYAYSRIGIHSQLENDQFILRGTIHQGGKEYLIRRGFFGGINVINQNPQNVISFKDLSERIKRLSLAGKGQGD